MAMIVKNDYENKFHEITPAETQVDTSDTAKESKGVSIFREASSVLGAGCCTYAFKKYSPMLVAGQLAKNLDKHFGICAKHNQIYEGAATKAYAKFGLAEKGIPFYTIDELKQLAEHTPELSNIKEIPKYFSDLIKKFAAQKTLEDRFYSCYHPTVKGIFVDRTCQSAVAFHEMGHALDFNGPLKLLAYSRYPLKFAGFGVIAIACLRRKKAKGEKSETKAGKVLDFIKDNCVALTAGCMAPTVLEEGIATIRGLSVAKKLLPKAHLQEISKLLGHAYSTYIADAAIMIGAAFIADRIRNLISGPKKTEET